MCCSALQTAQVINNIAAVIISSVTFLTGVVVRGPRCARGEVVVIECCDGRQLSGAHHGHGSHVEMFGHPEQAGFKYQLKLKKEETTK